MFLIDVLIPLTYLISDGYEKNRHEKVVGLCWNVVCKFNHLVIKQYSENKIR